MSTNMSGLVGQSVTRVEDERLLIGNGRYVADLEPEGVLHAAFLRSPLAHARIVSIDVAAARRAPGVTAVYTGADIERLTHAFPPLMMSPGLYTPVFYSLSAERVRHVGDPVALVIAASRHLAEDALELIEIDYEPLDAISSHRRSVPARATAVVGEGRQQRRATTTATATAMSTRCSPRPTGSSPNGCRANVSRTSRWRPAVR